MEISPSQDVAYTLGYMPSNTWPLSLILDESVMHQYSQILTVLMQAKVSPSSGRNQNVACCQTSYDLC